LLSSVSWVSPASSAVGGARGNRQVEAFRPSGRVGSVVHSFLSSPAFLDGEMRLCTSLSVRFGQAVPSGCGPKLSVVPSRAPLFG
ncbi:hypothetical protein CBR_g76913, partial [Chara braunii]